ncbi:creatininase family protein [Actinophytocola sp. NPDC049390]|uniref:creatininase family protein n=1 Tax=Actinophytocola sp. NPDC049390 TaxID=3363894 RepID=UPI0037B20B05
MATVEATHAAATGTVVIIPAGAFEQHGPGMPLATDLIRAEQIAARVAARLGHRTVVGPSIPVGVSPRHLAFAGTVTLSTSTFAAAVREYAVALVPCGLTDGGTGGAIAWAAENSGAQADQLLTLLMNGLST